MTRDMVCVQLAKQYAPPRMGLYRIGTNTGNEATAIQTLLDAAGTDDVVHLYGTFATSSTITVKGNLDASNAVINYTGTGTAIQVGQTGSTTHRRTVFLPRVVASSKSGTGWASVSGSIGVLIVNMQSSPIISIPHIQNFETGLVIRGTNAGCVYNNILIGHLDNNKINQRLDATGTGWSNQNTYIGGRFGHNSGEGTSVSGARHCLSVTGLSNPINNNKWLNASFEGDTPEYHLEVAGSANSWDNCRWEVTGGARVWLRADAIRNQILYGYKSESLVVTRESGSSRNHILSSNSWTASMSGTSAFLTENSSSSANPALVIMEAGGISASSDPTTAYAAKIGAQTCAFKRAADSEDRIRLDSVNGRIYLGSGSVAPTRYLGNLSTTAISVNGGNLSPGADDSLDLGQASFRWQYVRASKAVQTGAFATGSRPSAATAGVGAMILDTTLNKPVWSDGTNWRDATGTVV